MKKWLLPLVFAGTLTFSQNYFKIKPSVFDSVNKPLIEFSSNEMSDSLCAGPVPKVQINNSEGYTLDDLCEESLKNNPTLQSKKADIDASQARLQISKNAWWPDFYLTGSFIDSGSTALTRVGLRVNFNLDRNLLRKLDVRINSFLVDKSEEYLRREKIWVVNAVKELYFETVAIEKKIHIYDDFISSFEKMKTTPDSVSNSKLKLFTYKDERAKLLEVHEDLESRLKLAVFDYPFRNGFDIKIDSSDFVFIPVTINDSSIYRESVAQRFIPDYIEAERLGVKVERSTLSYSTSFNFSYEQMQIFGQGGEGYDNNSDAFVASFRKKWNSVSKRDYHKWSVAERISFLRDVETSIGGLLNGVDRAISRLESKKRIYESQSKLNYEFPEIANNDDINTLDQYLRHELRSVDALNDYLQALVNLNRYVMVSDENDYSTIGAPYELPPIIKLIFEDLDVPKEKKDWYINMML